MGIAQGIKSLFLSEFISAFFLAMKYLVAPKATLNYPHEKGPLSPRFRGEHALASLPERRGALHRLQACARPSARLRRLRSRPGPGATMAHDERPVTIST